jgi:beta-lactamase regulating signal transducer with metallopeptidase domain
MNSLIANISNHLQTAQFAAMSLDVLLKSFVVLALAGGVCALWRRASAGTRHLIWLLAVASLPCLPLLNNLTQPSWQRPLWTISTGSDSGNQISLALELTPKPIAQTSPVAPAVAETSTANQNFGGGGRKVAAQFSANWMAFGFAAWLAGAALVLFSAAVGQFRLRQFSRNAQRLDDADWMRLLAEARETLRLRRAVTLLQSADDVMPLTWGWLRPVVLLPAEAAHWPAERRRIVLLHELAHMKRWDCLTQLAAKIVCAIYWFNPLVWLAARQMCVERERACDDLVLNGGCKASDYAGHLVDIAGSFRRVPLAAAIAMARPSGLEQRVAAIVDASRTRRLRPVTLLAVLALVGGIIFCVSGCKTTVASRRAEESNPLRQQQIERLKIFSVEKEKQSQTLAAAAGETISPEYQEFFHAATSGDWQTVTNLFESFKQRHGQYGHAHGHSDPSLRTSFWSPVLEICLAYDNVVLCEPEYTQMAADGIVNSIPAGSIYFGGTDPGRGLPTAFCKSHVDSDPFYTLTQNALADGTYLDYLRKTYGDQRGLPRLMVSAETLKDKIEQLKSELSATQLEIAEAQKDGESERRAVRLSDLERKAKIQRGNLGFYENMLDQSRHGNPLPAGMLYIPTAEDSQKCFEDYVQDVTKRLENHQLKPGEDVKISDGRTQISGQVAVMAINGLLVKIIFDKNPGHEFFIEESFPLDWMYPNLEPHGLIFKINRQPLTELSKAMVQQDRDYWQKIMPGMIGGWLDDDTPVKDVTAFAEKVFLRHDLGGFTGDPRFVQNDYASRMFSKLRSSIAGLFAWRAEHATTTDEKERMARAADFAFRQAVAVCPSSPEAVHRYAEFLTRQQRETDARLVLAMSERFKSKSASQPAPPAKTPVFQMRLVLDAPTDDTEAMTNEFQNGSTARAAEVLNLQKTVLLDQTALKSAKLSKDQRGFPEIDLTFTDAGRKQFAEVTRQHLHQRLAIVIDGKLCSAPVIASEISGGKANINGNFSQEEAQTLTAKLNAAAGK